MMRRSYLFTSIAAVALLLCSGAAISAQVGQLRGHVLFKQADGTTIKAAGAQTDVFRTDLPGTFPAKADKNGAFVYAGLPYVGRYIICASMPNASPNLLPGARAGQDIDYEVVLSPGDGHRLTEAEAKGMTKPGGSGATPAESAADKAKHEADLKKLDEIKKENEKNTNINKVVGEAFKAGNAALGAKNY